MDPDTPIVLAAARYKSRDLAVEDYETVWKPARTGNSTTLRSRS